MKQVRGDSGADHSGNYENMTGSFNIDFETNLLINYDVFQVYGTDDPSICELFFTATFVILLNFFNKF